MATSGKTKSNNTLTWSKEGQWGAKLKNMRADIHVETKVGPNCKDLNVPINAQRGRIHYSNKEQSET